MSTLHSENETAVRRKFRAEALWNGVTMTLVGGWCDLAGYYLGSDGNVWAVQSAWVNQGAEADFRAKIGAGKLRGALFA